MNMSVDTAAGWFAGITIEVPDNQLNSLLERIDPNKERSETVGQFTVWYGYVNLDINIGTIEVQSIQAPFVIGLHQTILSSRAILLSPMLPKEFAEQSMLKAVGLLVRVAKIVEDKFGNTECNLEFN